MNNKLLIPIDFSEYSDQAIDYACQLHALVPHDITLIHVFTEHGNIYHNAQQNPELIDPRVAIVKRDLKNTLDKYQQQFPNITFHSLLKEGNLFDELRKTVSQDDYEAIIMGTKGSSGLDALLIGSNMFEVFQNTKVPVLAVPTAEKPFKTNKIGLLCNFKEGEIDVLKQALNLYGTDFELLLIHVNTANESISNIDTAFEAFIEKVINATGIDDISYVIKPQTTFLQNREDVSSAINSVIADELIDVLLVTKSKKGFLRKIIEENVVKRMAFQLQIPKFFGRS